MTSRIRRVAVALLLVPFLVAGSLAQAGSLPAGFQETVVWGGFVAPTAIRFAPDGRVFVAEKRGRIKVFSSITDPTPDLFADLSTNVHDYWDRGLLGLALDPQFPTRPYVYVLYTYDFDPNTPSIPAPRWGDTCPTPPGGTADGCVVNGRLSRLQINASNQLVGGEQVVLQNNWCQQYPSHSIGDLVFDSTGALVVSAGDGASFDFVDFGQGGSAGSPTPKNPCGDPPTGRGGSQSAPTAEGGALRSQDLRTSADPLSYDGSILRINPDTGAAWPDNPLIGGITADDRTIAHGLRNPFRMTARPGTGEIWVGDVGWDGWEEINRIVSPSDMNVENFGWPCYEGAPRQAAYETRNLDICENLYDAGPTAIQTPFYAFAHGAPVTPGGDGCNTGTSSISGLAFYTAGTYPAAYSGALFFADYARECIYVMRTGAGGLPDPATRTAFDVGVSAVDLRVGPGGDLFFVDIPSGEVRRIRYPTSNSPPTAVIQANPTGGPVPLNVQFNGAASSDPDPGTTLTYAWDLDGDGQYDDSTAVAPSRTYNTPGQITVRLRVTDNQLATGTASQVISPGNSAPSAAIQSPSTALHWSVGEVISFAGSGNDPETGAMPASAMHWDIILHHCPGGAQTCHVHTIQQFDGIAAGTFVAPDHEWYSFLEFRLRVTDAFGLTGQAAVSVDPEVVQLSYDTVPSGLALVVGAVADTTPFTRPAIVGSLNSVSAPESQTLADESYQWLSWSNGGPRSQEIVADAAPATYVATYTSEKILIVAPHPGGEARSTAGVIARARVGGLSVKTVFLTNGDAAGGTAGGLARQAEAVLAAATLGMAEDDLIFLGYPESFLATVYATYPGPAAFVTPWGRSLTYGNRGLGLADYHTHRFGSAAPYNRASLVTDLADYLDAYRPTHIFAPSPADRHFDHRTAYAALIEALELVSATDPTYAPTVHTTIVWADPPTQSPTWPELANPAAPFTPPPGLSSAGLTWSQAERLDVPAGMQATPLALNAKYLMLAAYASQGGASGVLGRFLHKDEFFWVESPLSSNQPPHVDAGADQIVAEGALVALQGSGCSDPDGDPLSYVWRQTGGTTVQLSDSTLATPTFVTPTGGSQVLAFELLVGDGQVMSVADAVQIRVQGASNTAPVANAGPDQNVAEGTLVQLDGSASTDPNAQALTYQWTQTAGPVVELSDATAAQPTFVAPAGLTQNSTVTFRLVVSDGFLASTPDFASVVAAWGPNVAPQASVTASSQNVSTGQLATKAVDRVVAGYPGDFTKEWATNGQRTGAWIQLNWPRPFQLDRVTLYDRPNTNDRVMGGTLLFSDGSTVAVGSLDNAGAGLNVSFTPRVTTSLRFTVTAVSAPTENVGLAELEARRLQGQVDTDQDGWSIAEGDCNDSERLTHPGADEIPYNGVDDDCNAATGEDDLDQDGVTFAGDCNDANPLARTIPPEVMPLHADRIAGAARLSWSDVRPVAGSESVYDVIAGTIDELLGDAGFARSACLVSMTQATTYDDARVTPEPGFYYLVRAKNSCGFGSSGDASVLPDPRDALEASGVCP